MNKLFLFLYIILHVSLNVCVADDEEVIANQLVPLTVVRSESLEMTSNSQHNYFYFTDNVTINGNNLLVKCDNLEVTASRSGEADATIGRIGVIKKIIAIGSVEILQAGRAALAGRAELLPAEDKIILTDSPKILDRKAVVSGWRITLIKGKRTAIVENNPDDNEGHRPTVVLDALPDFGFDNNVNSDSEKRETE